jgi:hypothetical protein
MRREVTSKINDLRRYWKKEMRVLSHDEDSCMLELYLKYSRQCRYKEFNDICEHCAYQALECGPKLLFHETRQPSHGNFMEDIIDGPESINLNDKAQEKSNEKSQKWSAGNNILPMVFSQFDQTTITRSEILDKLYGEMMLLKSLGHWVPSSGANTDHPISRSSAPYASPADVFQEGAGDRYSVS